MEGTYKFRFPRLYLADIGATKGKGPLLWFSQNLIKPKTDRIHFFIIGDYIPWEDDYVILEAISSGIRVGRLSFYEPAELEIYRVKLGYGELGRVFGTELRRRASLELTKVGRARYDWVLFIQLALGGIGLLLRGKLPPWRPEQFPYGRDKKYICTEAAAEAWRGVGHPIIPEGVVPVPSAFIQALQEGKLRRVFP